MPIIILSYLSASLGRELKNGTLTYQLTRTVSRKKHTKISSEEISDGREYSLLFLYVKVVVSCKVVGLYGARRRLTNWQDTLF
ncbi:hypothetical protein [Streptococcus sinensis]|uniref:hypothetical protein n=1 Tax=Streptococcus sinensis TaxID=176090 RepID=UPI001C2E91DB|nr:hypothetical protein [Streptococcus sinensis]MCD1277716.1 hypothetical protein [Streptococcus sinensis]